MKTPALFAPILVAVSAPGPDDTAAQEDPVIFNLWPPVRVTPFLNPPPALPARLTARTAGTISLAVSPASPGPADLVSITVTTETSDTSLVLERTTVDKHGREIVVDLTWARQTSTGVPAGREHEVTEPLGTFRPGLYQVSVHSRGVLEGEAGALFNVRASAPVADSVFQLAQNLH